MNTFFDWCPKPMRAVRAYVQCMKNNLKSTSGEQSYIYIPVYYDTVDIACIKPVNKQEY